jgi:hypothetical protein
MAALHNCIARQLYASPTIGDSKHISPTLAQERRLPNPINAPSGAVDLPLFDFYITAFSNGMFPSKVLNASLLTLFDSAYPSRGFR